MRRLLAFVVCAASLAAFGQGRTVSYFPAASTPDYSDIRFHIAFTSAASAGTSYTVDCTGSPVCTGNECSEGDVALDLNSEASVDSGTAPTPPVKQGGYGFNANRGTTGFDRLEADLVWNGSDDYDLLPAAGGVIGFWFQYGVGATTCTNGQRLMDYVGSAGVRLSIQNTDELQAIAFDGTNSLACLTSAKNYAKDTWYYAEIEYDPAGDAIELRIGGTSACTNSGTLNSLGSGGTALRWGSIQDLAGDCDVVIDQIAISDSLARDLFAYQAANVTCPR